MLSVYLTRLFDAVKLMCEQEQEREQRREQLRVHGGVCPRRRRRRQSLRLPCRQRSQRRRHALRESLRGRRVERGREIAKAMPKVIDYYKKFRDIIMDVVY